LSTPDAGQRGNARRLLRRIVGPPPEKPTGRVSSAIFLLVFVVGFSAAALSWWEEPSLSVLSIACVMLGSLLFAPANPAHRLWGGELTRDLVRLGGMALFLVGWGLLVAQMALSRSWGWVWYSVFGLALCIVVAVAGHYYGPEAEPHPEEATPEGRDPIN
jgi:hypothetical protein